MRKWRGCLLLVKTCSVFWTQEGESRWEPGRWGWSPCCWSGSWCSSTTRTTSTGDRRTAGHKNTTEEPGGQFRRLRQKSLHWLIPFFPVMAVNQNLFTVHVAVSRPSNDLTKEKNFTSANAARSDWNILGSHICTARGIRVHLHEMNLTLCVLWGRHANKRTRRWTESQFMRCNVLNMTAKRSG